ncbi:MAG: DUF4340 domain-containing protein, partial [Verrucomicrobiota bacterium]
LQWQELSIFELKPEQIHRFSIVTDKEVWLERGENKQWRWLKGEGAINQTNVESLVGTLSHLHAVRWAGATAPQHGLDKPQMTITFMFGDEKTDSHTLKIGAPTGNDMWFARIGKREGTFVISAPDFSALKLPLVSHVAPSPAQQQASSPTPTPTH